MSALPSVQKLVLSGAISGLTHLLTGPDSARLNDPHLEDSGDASPFECIRVTYRVPVYIWAMLVSASWETGRGGKEGKGQGVLDQWQGKEHSGRNLKA